jgi:hypothetical protein
MAAMIPLTVTREATDFISQRRLQEPFQRMIDHISEGIPGVRAVAVSLQPRYEEDEDPCVILDVTREKPCLGYDPAEENWQRWISETFPPEVFTHFCLLSAYP